MHKFIDKYNYGEPYIYVHPYKQKEAKELVNALPPWVDMVILFGSSVQTCCKPSSDMDICIIGKPPTKHAKYISVGELPLDILHYDTKADFLNNMRLNPHSATADAYEKGVVIYAK